MTFIKIPSKFKNEDDLQLERLGVETSGASSYIYYNVSTCHVAPTFNEEGDVIPDKCTLVDVLGNTIATLNLSVTEYFQLTNSQCVAEIKNGLDKFY